MGNNHTFIPLSVPNMGEKELEYTMDAIRTGWISSVGAYVTRFEKELASYAGVPNGVACQSGTAGLHLALIALGIEAGDLVIAPTLTFIAAVNPVRYLGADPIFMDCDESLCLDPQKLRAFCEKECYVKDNTLFHKETNRRIPALIVVHVFGNMADMESILTVANDYNLKVLEDATEALGTRYEKGPLKGCMAGTIGHIGVYSFNGNKVISTGGGGMVVSHNTEILGRIKYLSTQAKDDEIYFIHNEVGYNYRMTNVQAAIGVAQLEKLELFIETKKKNYGLYLSLFKNNTELHVFSVRKDVRSNYWMYGLFLQNRSIRDTLFRYLESEHIQTRPVWALVHEQKPYLGAISYNIEKAYYYSERLLNIPCSSGLSQDDVKFVAESVIRFFSNSQIG